MALMAPPLPLFPPSSFLPSSSSDDNVRRREEDGDGGDDGERREGDEAEPVDHHRRELTHQSTTVGREGRKGRNSWLPDGYSRIFRSYVFGPSGFWTMAPLRYTAVI